MRCEVVLYCSDGSPHILDVGICFARRFSWTECTPAGLLHEYMRQIARKYVIYKRVSTARLSPEHNGFALLMRVRVMTDDRQGENGCVNSSFGGVLTRVNRLLAEALIRANSCLGGALTHVRQQRVNVNP